MKLTIDVSAEAIAVLRRRHAKGVARDKVSLAVLAALPHEAPEPRVGYEFMDITADAPQVYRVVSLQSPEAIVVVRKFSNRLHEGDWYVFPNREEWDKQWELGHYEQFGRS